MTQARGPLPPPSAHYKAADCHDPSAPSRASWRHLCACTAGIVATCWLFASRHSPKARKHEPPVYLGSECHQHPATPKPAGGSTKTEMAPRKGKACHQVPNAAQLRLQGVSALLFGGGGLTGCPCLRPQLHRRPLQHPHPPPHCPHHCCCQSPLLSPHTPDACSGSRTRHPEHCLHLLGRTRP